MLRKILPFIISIAAAILFARLPIFPLISEMREYSPDGESLSQVWSFVSLPEFHDAAQFAQVGWLDTTWNNYKILFLVNYAALVVVFLFLWRILGQFFRKRG